MKQTILARELPLWLSEFKSSSRVGIISRMEIESELIRRALKDDVFKTQMCSNCKATIEKLYGVELPSDLSVNVLQESDSLFYLVLPHNPYQGIPEDELVASLGLTMKDVAKWVLENGRNIVVDKENTIKIVLNAWEDEAFREKLLSYPKQIIEAFSGESLPSNVNIELKEETPQNIYIVLPQCADVFFYEQNLENQDLNLNLVIGSGKVTTHSTCQITNGSCSICF